jgi:hypothetical protein
MRFLTAILILPFYLLLVSCSRENLPPIKDAETLRKECSVLFQKFPTEQIPTNIVAKRFTLKFHEISQEQWPPSVAALNPVGVRKNIAGIFIYLKAERKRIENGNFIIGYFVLINPNKIPLPNEASMLIFSRNSLGFIFKSTDFGDIYVVEQPMSVQ